MNDRLTEYDGTGRSGHANDMTRWDEIRCQEGHTEHASRLVHVDLAKPHGYPDCPEIPERFHREFDMAIWDWRTYRKATSYCPAHDAVSETIDQLGIWEPAETVLTLSALAAQGAAATLVDVGAQIGWFTALALSGEGCVHAIDAEAENLRIIGETVEANSERSASYNWQGCYKQSKGRLGVEELYPAWGTIDLAKIDVEGAERDAVQMLWPWIEGHDVNHLLIEISPCFADYYPDLVCDLIDQGYLAWVVPTKANPRPVLDKLPEDLGKPLNEWDRKALRAWIAEQWQVNMWFALPEAAWG